MKESLALELSKVVDKSALTVKAFLTSLASSLELDSLEPHRATLKEYLRELLAPPPTAHIGSRGRGVTGLTLYLRAKKESCTKSSWKALSASERFEWSTRANILNAKAGAIPAAAETVETVEPAAEPAAKKKKKEKKKKSKKSKKA
ncbi:hypothetical protein TeGR_g31 [Tetraparma gracilis]|uniref:Histone H1 n=1 Tax=Tetraparma gracilis TaxID=2962635 RepID=A0ABQ6N590_9STRA|nr:hypothetical protein TeGR_g31 [Tetraparma gracilis]